MHIIGKGKLPRGAELGTAICDNAGCFKKVTHYAEFVRDSPVDVGTVRFVRWWCKDHFPKDLA